MTAKKPLYMTSIDLEEAFDQVPRYVIRSAVHKLRIEQWLVHLVQFIYKAVRNRERVARSLILEWVFIRALSSTRFSLSLCKSNGKAMNRNWGN